MIGTTVAGTRRAARVRILAAVGVGLGALVLAVVAARWVWTWPAVAAFVRRYPGVAAGSSYRGTPAWVAVLHAANLFLLVQIIRSGLVLRRGGRPCGHWTPRTGRRKGERVTVEQWFHVALDLVWLLTGLVFVVLLILSGRWVRLVPTTVDVVPNALSVALQYLSGHWPEPNGWLVYNALQQLAYGGVVFVLAPVAALTGLRMSLWWPPRPKLDRWFTVERTRALHAAVMVLFVLFVVIHVTLVASTGVVRALDHMFAARDGESLAGVYVLVGVLLVSAAAVAAARPVILRSLAGLTGRVTR
ncbi:cytochrome b/b6 domain-containing protein [Raineyella fluvialis]|uniref:Cytochrome b/b6 domain-containing protein n=1 Tax=Raineyella fluvialis TaxID=2662261 RepID=A0A5Q2FDR4_9ACTN|nr:cytochrome b/b6 domain-containing protein [Raineyella fluvialis]QGF22416.1 cytochrome b/b6 domain-containing protein [Raineyella fluvialis]